jgi:hypothetical protein
MAITPVNIPISVTGSKAAEQALAKVADAASRAGKAQEKAAADSTKAVEREAAKKLRAEERRVQAQMKLWLQEESAERKKTGEANRQDQARLQQIIRLEQAQQDIRAKFAKKRVQVAQEAADKERAAAERSREYMGHLMGRSISRSITSTLGAAHHISRQVLGIMGGFDIADSIRERANVHGLASAIAIQGSHAEGHQFKSQDVLNTATKEGIRTGRGTEETLHGLQKFIDITGNLQQAQDSIKLIGDYADASGSTLKDMSTAAAELFASGTVKNAHELADALGTFVEMGKGGAIELKDFAKDFAKLTGTGLKFGNASRFENVATLGALAEVGKKHGGAKGPVQALTSVQAFGNDIFNHFDKIQSTFKMKLRDKNGDMRSARDIIADVVVGTAGKPEKLKGLFGAQGRRAVEGSIDTYNQAIKGGSTKDQARSAVIKELTDLSAAVLSTEQAAEQAASRRAEADRQFAIVTEKLKVAIGEQLLPVVLRLVPEITAAIPKLVRIAEAGGDLAAWFANNPFKGLGAIVAAGVTKDLAAAAIGGVITKLLATQIGTMMALPIAAIAINSVGEMFVAETNKIEKGENSKAKVQQAKLEDSLRKVRLDPTEENIAEAKRVSEESGSMAEELQKRNDSKTGKDAVAGIMFGKEGAEGVKKQWDENNKATQDLTAALTDLKKALESREFSGDGGRGARALDSPNRDTGMGDRGGAKK